MPDEITELRELLETAMSNLAIAEDDMEAAHSELEQAQVIASQCDQAWQQADRDESEARRRYIDALKRHGLVRTADGPRPAGEVAPPRPLEHSGLWPNPPAHQGSDL